MAVGDAVSVVHWRPLSEVLRHDYPGLSPVAKRQLVTALGTAVRRWHDAGTYVRALADIRVRLHQDGADFEPAACRVALGRGSRRRVHALGGLLADCWLDTSRAARQRFLVAYDPPAGALGIVQRRCIEQVAYRQLRAAWRRRVRACFACSRSFVAGRRDGFRYHGARAMAATALQALLPDPDAVLEAGEIYKPGTRTHAGRVQIDGTARFLKRINYRGRRYGMKYLWRRSRAMHNWAIMWAFRYRGIPVADPILCLEERRFRFLRRSYVLTDFARGAERLKVAWAGLDDAQRTGLLVRLAGILGRMHRFGCLHGDLKWDNILVDGGEGRVTLVDFDGSRIVRKPKASKARKDLARFLQDLRQVDPAGRWKRLFYHSWHKWITGL